MCVRNASSYDFMIKLILENSLQEASTVFGWTGLSRLLMPCELKWRFCSPRSGKYCKNFWENRGIAETVKKPILFSILAKMMLREVAQSDHDHHWLRPVENGDPRVPFCFQ